MSQSGGRTRRVGEQIRRELALLLRDELKDPRARMVAISDVEVSRDLAHAKVFISLLGDEQAEAAALAGLGSAAGFLRRELGKRLHLRAIPQLHFYRDTSMAQGAKIEALLAEARRKDHDDES